MSALMIALWVIAGVAGFCYWWRRDYDLTVADLPTCIIAGTILGPLAWLVGASLHGRKSQRVLWRRQT